MTLLTYSLVALPLWAALFALYFILCRQRLQRESLIAKCAASFLSVGSVLFAYLSRVDLTVSKPALLLASPFFWFFVLCTVGDAVLELSFVPGMACFAAGHICLIVSTLSIADLKWSAAVWVLAMALSLYLFRRELPRIGAMAIAGCIYVGVLSATLAVNLPLPFIWWSSVSGGRRASYCLLALGALVFFVSDLMVAKQQFGNQEKKLQKPIMVTYWLALYLISASAWL